MSIEIIHEFSEDVVAYEFQGRYRGPFRRWDQRRKWGSVSLRPGNRHVSRPGTMFSNIGGDPIDFQYDSYEWRLRPLVRVSRFWTYVPIVDPPPEYMKRLIANDIEWARERGKS